MIKRAIKTCFGLLGLDVRRKRPPEPPASAAPPPVAPPHRMIGDIEGFLESVRGRGFAPRGIIDVGANKGLWTAMARRLFPGVPVIMIEPLDEMQARLEAICAEDPQVSYIKAGAGRAVGELVQTLWPDLAGSSFLPIEDPSGADRRPRRKTPVTTLDTVLAGKPGFHPDLVKLDIQGFELEALSGGETLFGRTELFVVETSLFRFIEGIPLTRDVIRFMADRHYEIYDITSFIRRPYDGALGQVDLAFVKANGMFRDVHEWGPVPRRSAQCPASGRTIRE